MTTLVYKQTHTGDPGENEGVFGSGNCMGRIRGYGFNAVIGVGGMGSEAKECGINGKITWIGTGARKIGLAPDGHPAFAFEHFRYFRTNGPFLSKEAPHLAKKMVTARYATKFNQQQEMEIRELLALAKDAPPSRYAGH